MIRTIAVRPSMNQRPHPSESITAFVNVSQGFSGHHEITVGVDGSHKVGMSIKSHTFT